MLNIKLSKLPFKISNCPTINSNNITLKSTMSSWLTIDNFIKNNSKNSTLPWSSSKKSSNPETNSNSPEGLKTLVLKKIKLKSKKMKRNRKAANHWQFQVFQDWKMKRRSLQSQTTRSVLTRLWIVKIQPSNCSKRHKFCFWKNSKTAR